jgi:signal transduction histidine kinase
MDPTLAVPAHFTLEILSVVAAGLLIAWAIFQNRWIAAAGATSLGVASALHAGSFVSSDDAVVVVVLRIAGIAAIAVGAYNIRVRREMFFGGLALLLGGAIWGAVSGGSAASLTVGPHILGAVGALVMMLWTWWATRQSVPLRLLTSFVLVLGVAVLVMGGSVSRVAAVEKRDEEYGRLGPTAAVVRARVGAIATDLAVRAAALSPELATRLSGTPPHLSAVLHEGESAVAFSTSGEIRATVNGRDVPPYDVASVARTPAFSSARAARVATSYEIYEGTTSSGLGVIGASPVFRPGGERTAKDVIAVIAFVRPLPIAEIRSMVDEVSPMSDAAVGDHSGASVATTTASGLTAPLKDVRSTTLETIKTPKGKWPAVITPIDNTSGVNLLVAVPGSRVVDATRTLVRSFLIALLASALLAVVVALWLSARITRPMLDLVDEGERLKTDFLASVSHELRTPLTPIRGYTEILRRGRVPARRASGYLDEIGQAAQRLERIVSLLVDVASIEAGRFHINIDDVPAAQLIEEAGERWTTAANEHHIRVAADAGLPDVKADDVAIGRVLDELVDNAIKFSPEGSTITLAAETAKGGVTFSVRDEGQGIEPERLAELGHAFEQLDSGDTRRFGGLGLGLNYARGVLRTHNTKLELKSAPREGTTSFFTLAAAGTLTRMPANAPRTRKASKSKAR